jgi:hypothetical protein
VEAAFLLVGDILTMVSNENAGVDKLITFGKMALEQGWYDKAHECFEQVLALDATNREALKGLARVNEVLSRKATMAVEPMEAETPTGPSLVKRLMIGVNSVFEALEEYSQKRARVREEQSQKRAEEQSRKRARAHKPAEAYIKGPIRGKTRTALIRSLTMLLDGGDASSYEERLRELDLKIARTDRSRRTLVRERTRTEKQLGEVGRIMEGAIGPSHQQLSAEHDRLAKKLDEADLSIAQLDRERRQLMKERKKLEPMCRS